MKPNNTEISHLILAFSLSTSLYFLLFVSIGWGILKFKFENAIKKKNKNGLKFLLNFLFLL